DEERKGNGSGRGVDGGQLADGLVHRAVAAPSQRPDYVGGDVSRRRSDPAGQQRALYREAPPASLRGATARQRQLRQSINGGRHRASLLGGEAFLSAMGAHRTEAIASVRCLAMGSGIASSSRGRP